MAINAGPVKQPEDTTAKEFKSILVLFCMFVWLIVAVVAAIGSGVLLRFR